MILDTDTVGYSNVEMNASGVGRHAFSYDDVL